MQTAYRIDILARIGIITLLPLGLPVFSCTAQWLYLIIGFSLRAGWRYASRRISTEKLTSESV